MVDLRIECVPVSGWSRVANDHTSDQNTLTLTDGLVSGCDDKTRWS